MKIKKILLLSLAILPLTVSLIALIFLPDQIPAHYGSEFTVDRYGSKFEILILPIAIFVLSFIFLLPGILMKNEQNQKVILDFGIVRYSKNTVVIFRSSVHFYRKSYAADQKEFFYRIENKMEHEQRYRMEKISTVRWHFNDYTRYNTFNSCLCFPEYLFDDRLADRSSCYRYNIFLYSSKKRYEQCRMNTAL